VREAFQDKGIGRQLLGHITAFAQLGGGQKLWCNARLSAVGFYQKQGFETEGTAFVKNNIDYVIMGKAL
jgi:ribosomal protein S18 acetylase RimI-like enzyme